MTFEDRIKSLDNPCACGDCSECREAKMLVELLAAREALDTIRKYCAGEDNQLDQLCEGFSKKALMRIDAFLEGLE